MKFDIDVKAPTRRVVAGVQRYQQARREIQPYVGDLGYTCDSADDLYRTALTKLGHDAAGLPEGCATALWPVLSRQKPASSRQVAMDAKATSRRQEMFPNGNRLRDNPFN